MKNHLLLYFVTVVVLLAADRQKSFVDTAPTGAETAEKDDVPNFDEVKQLEGLKESLGKTFSVLKSHSSVFSDVNGQKESHAENKEEVKANGKLVAKVEQSVDSAQDDTQNDATPSTRVRTDVEIPARGIHKTIMEGDGTNDEEEEVTETVERRSSSRSTSKYGPFPGTLQYTPLDMAEYVFWTGDEKGVTQALEDFLEGGVITREQAISYLQDIKTNLELLQEHFNKKKLQQHKEEHQKDKARLFEKFWGLDKPRGTKSMNQVNRDMHVSKKNMMESDNSNNLKEMTEEDYEELLERLRVADFLYTEYSLEEVIYQLAKVMFTQSLNRGSTEAQEALQKFTAFLENEAEQGHITRTIEKKVLDVMVAALTDTLGEHPHLLNKTQQQEEAPVKPSAAQLIRRLMQLNLNNGGSKGEKFHHFSKLSKSGKND